MLNLKKNFIYSSMQCQECQKSKESFSIGTQVPPITLNFWGIFNLFAQFSCIKRMTITSNLQHTQHSLQIFDRCSPRIRNKSPRSKPSTQRIQILVSINFVLSCFLPKCISSSLLPRLRRTLFFFSFYF